MSVLEAKDQQLRREIEEKEQQLRWQGCDLTPLVGRLSLGQLREVSKALQDTLASAGQIPFHAEPPETIRRYWWFPNWFWATHLFDLFIGMILSNAFHL